MSKKRFLTVILGLIILALFITACNNDDDDNGDVYTTPPSVIDVPPPTDDVPSVPATIYDRIGMEVSLPAEINTIVAIAPSISEIIIALGLGDSIVAADNNFVEGLNPSLKVLDMFGLDLEHIISLNPDLVVATDMIMFAGDPLQAIRDLGIAVAYIPSSDSIEGVKEDIRFLAQVLGVPARGDEIIAEMAAEIASIQAIVQNITDRRTVYFEISASPFTFGSDTFLHELVDLAGGINIFEDMVGWFSPSIEEVLVREPDVILTSTNYIDNPIGEILNRSGWGVLTAIQEGNVHFIDTDDSSRPSQNIVRAIREIATVLYPELFN